MRATPKAFPIIWGGGGHNRELKNCSLLTPAVDNGALNSGKINGVESELEKIFLELDKFAGFSHYRIFGPPPPLPPSKWNKTTI